MAGRTSTVALVRCPKCGHLLPELPPYSVYCCGDCGAFLQAEKGTYVDDALSENSGERNGEGSEREANGEILGLDGGRADEMPATSARSSKSVGSRYGDTIRKSPIRKSNLGDSDADAYSKSSGRSIDRDTRNPLLMESGLDGRGRSTASSVHLGFRNSARIGEFDEQRPVGNEFVAGYEEIESREKVGAWFDHVKNETGYSNILIPRGEQVGRRDDQFVDQMESEYDDSYPMRRVQVPYDDYHGVPRGHIVLRGQDGYDGGVHGNKKASNLHQRFPVYPNEGPSNYRSYHGFDQPRHYQESYTGSSSVQNVEMDRAELVRLYNDLKKQLSITGDLPENPIRRGHHRISSADCYVEPDDYLHGEPLRLRRPTTSVDLDARIRPRFESRGRVPVPPSRVVPNEFPLDDDSSWPQNLGKTPYHRTHFHPQRSAHEYIPYDPSGLDPTAFSHRRYPYYQTNTTSEVLDPQHSSGSGFPYSKHGGVSSNSRSSVVSKPDVIGSPMEHKKSVVNKNQLVCHPIVGAAPFVLCYNCSQLLRLPKKLTSLKRTQLTLQCGSCGTTLSFDLNKKSSHASTHLQQKLNSTEVYDEPSKTPESELKGTLDNTAGITNRESYDFDATGYTFPSTDSEPSQQLADRMLNSSEAEKQQSLCPFSSASKGDHAFDNVVSKTNASSSLMNNIPPRPPPGSPLQEHLDYSANFSAMKSDYLETDVPGHDNEITEVDSSSLNDVQKADEPADLEIDSVRVWKLDKKDESSFDDITGNGHKAFSPPHNVLNTKNDVSINGQPLAHRVAQKAEKLAGPISPGTYWYDSRAGFWGIMGDCCLGIIPSYIEEFNFPMPKGCSGGNTGISVNGRELHENDLELLASRGFPRTRNKSYVVDISGKVEDEETGDVVAELGKLAPTVERTKRGFGMQPPEIEED